MTAPAAPDASDARNGSSAIRLGEHAVVIGGSMAGMLAARVLADHFDRVTILERDRLPEGAEARKGLPQARHIHVLLAAGRRALDRLLPGVTGAMVAAGALEYDGINDVEWVHRYGPALRFPSDLQVVGASRDLIDWAVRRQVLANPRIQALPADVTGLRIADGRVVGVTADDRAEPSRRDRSFDAALVIDASGRGSRGPQWLLEHGYPRPTETVVNGFLGYATRLVRVPANWAGDWKALYIQSAPPDRRRGGVIALVEGGRWFVSLAGGGKDYPPTDEDAFRAFARSVADPRFAAAYEASEPLTPIVGTRSTENRVRHYESLPRRPEGFLVTGDAACAFNPVYGQGMSTAAIGAETLRHCLRTCLDGKTSGLAARFQGQLARANNRPWLLATGTDYLYREVEGPVPRWTTGLSLRYIDRVISLTTRSPLVRTKFTEVIHLVRAPASLFTPDVILRVAFARG
jgi:2-polyprenyl-6-methoxyphenol hydroxylase-like FAD-dependent oxidoreductase